MAYIMDMANGTEHPVEEPSYQVVRESRLDAHDTAQLTEHPQLQLAVLEVQTQTEARPLPAASVEALIKALED
jgi:hypothetical protein